jgi:heme/copper-type cytochrome/quinol oxidase subunit 4
MLRNPPSAGLGNGSMSRWQMLKIVALALAISTVVTGSLVLMVVALANH